jgi:hypothetical protein
MSGRPDYDVGDLVVCVDDGQRGDFQPPVARGRVYMVANLAAPGTVSSCGRMTAHKWGVFLLGVPLRDAISADRFRKIDPKPPEFWTGTVDADAPEHVPA